MANTIKNHNLTKSIPKLYLHPDYADIHFEFKSNGETVRVPAHKYILAITSPVFAAMFFGPLKEKDVVEIVDFTESAFKEFLQLFYRPEVTLTMENIEAVARLTDKYDILDCLSACTSFFEEELNDDNMIWGYQLAISLNHQPMRQYCENQIPKMISKIFKSDAFLRCDRVVLEHILRIELLNVNELDVFNGCIEWAKSSCRKNGLDENDPVNLRNELGECFYLIQFWTMKIAEFGKILSNKLYEGLFSRNELSEVVRAKSIQNFMYELFTHVYRFKKWNDDKVLECSSRHDTELTWSHLKKQESTWFTTNKSLLLGGKLTCGVIYKHGPSGGYVDIKSTISVVEYEAPTISSDAENKVLYNGEIEFKGKEPVLSSVILSQPILVHPNKMYEIRLQFETDWNGYMHKNTWKTQVKLDDETIIKFHANPLNSGGDQRSTLINKLHFNRI